MAQENINFGQMHRYVFLKYVFYYQLRNPRKYQLWIIEWICFSQAGCIHPSQKSICQQTWSLMVRWPGETPAFLVAYSLVWAKLVCFKLEARRISSKLYGWISPSFFHVFFWGNMGNLEIFFRYAGNAWETYRDLLRSFVVSVDGFTWCFPSPWDGSQELVGLGRLIRCGAQLPSGQCDHDIPQLYVITRLQ